MPLTYKAERKQLHDMADHLRKRARRVRGQWRCAVVICGNGSRQQGTADHKAGEWVPRTHYAPRSFKSRKRSSK